MRCYPLYVPQGLQVLMGLGPRVSKGFRFFDIDHNLATLATLANLQLWPKRVCKTRCPLSALLRCRFRFIHQGALILSQWLLLPSSRQLLLDHPHHVHWIRIFEYSTPAASLDSETAPRASETSTLENCKQSNAGRCGSKLVSISSFLAARPHSCVRRCNTDPSPGEVCYI